MKKTFYIQLDKNNIVRDIVEMQVDGYQQVELDVPLPIGAFGGWFKYENDELVEYPELKPKPEITTDDLQALQLAVAELGAQAEANTAETQLAIAELANTILGGE